ncbi:MAG: GHKL domain-containing protein [Alphaproteobacteria bacterium]|jgi:two-component system phosphate regulon sensor histidine kinase PhoR|nr:GHKL domain-containing protein [Alphaproteobacteria bacterium]
MSPPAAVSISRFLVISALFTAPTAATLGALVVLETLDPWTAGLALLTVAVLSGLTVSFYFRDALRISGYLERLAVADDHDAHPPRPSSELGKSLVRVVSRLHHSWRKRTRLLNLRLEAALEIIETLPDPLIVVDRRRTINRFNGVAGTLFGDRLVGRDLADILRHPHVLAAVDEVLRGGGSRSVEFSRPVPVEQVFEARVKPFRGLLGDHVIAEEADADEIPAALITLHDITAIKRSEQMRADFVANASHELRTPLTTLIGFIDTLRGAARDDSEARDRFLSIMDEQAIRMSRLINDLLSLSRIELDEHMAPGGQVDVVSALHHVVDTLEIKAAGRGMTLVFDPDGELPPAIGDTDQLMQVFQNLVDNAIKYARENSEIRVTACRARSGAGDHAVIVAVRDQGDGIARNHLPRLTERFYRVDPARSRALGGTGLGLAIVKHIVSRHRGRLSIESELGKGSTFSVILPAVGETGATGTVQPAAGSTVLIGR